MDLFGDRLAAACQSVGAPVAVGLDPHLDRLPARLRASYEGQVGREFRTSAARAVLAFNRIAIDSLMGRVAAVKPQIAFYEQLGAAGFDAFERTCDMARQAGLLVIADAKRGDISSTAAAYGRALLDPDGPVGADALTVNPWMGSDTLTPYLPWCRDAGRGLFVLVRTTNPGSAELQVGCEHRLAYRVADSVDRIGREFVGDSGLSSIGAVVGASASNEAPELREHMPRAWFLVPGVGAQGGDAAAALAGACADGTGALPVAARSVLFPAGESGEFDDDPGLFIESRARDLVDQVVAALSAVRP